MKQPALLSREPSQSSQAGHLRSSRPAISGACWCVAPACRGLRARLRDRDVHSPRPSGRAPGARLPVPRPQSRRHLPPPPTWHFPPARHWWERRARRPLLARAPARSLSNRA